jgi:hypothetical protein
VISTGVKIPYSFLYGKCINHIYLLNLLLSPPSPISDLPLVWPVFSQYCLHLYWAYNPHMRENMWPLTFWTWLTLLKMMFSSSIHLPANDKISFFLMATVYKYQIFLIHPSVEGHQLESWDREFSPLGGHGFIWKAKWYILGSLWGQRWR